MFVLLQFGGKSFICLFPRHSLFRVSGIPGFLYNFDIHVIDFPVLC